MPYLWNLQYQEQPVKQYLRDLFNAVELKDIIRRKQIRDVDMLERILTYVTANIGNTFSATTISKYLKSEGRKVAPETIERDFGIYQNVRDNYPKYVLSLDEFDMSRNGIIHQNIRDFLLEGWVFLFRFLLWESVVRTLASNMKNKTTESWWGIGIVAFSLASKKDFVFSWRIHT